MRNIETIRTIPILYIARELGIVVNRSNKAMCFGGHDKKTPSLSFTPEKNLWNCFGCDLSGDGIKLVQKVLGVNFVQACDWLNSHLLGGISTQPIQRKPICKQLSPSEVNPDSEIYEWLINTTELSAPARQYLTDIRGFRMETLEYFNIRSLDEPKRKLKEAQQIWGSERLVQAGLVSQAEQTTKSVWWAPIILFPFYSCDNRVVYIQGRQIGDKVPKYLNLKGVNTTIYNLKVVNTMKNGELLHICEGITDVLSAHEQQLKAIGILGAKGFKDEWAQLFIKYRIKIIPDNDDAGRHFTERVRAAFNKIGKPVQAIKLSGYNDLTEFAKGGNNSGLDRANY